MTKNDTDCILWGGRLEFDHRGKADALSKYGGVITDLNASNVFYVENSRSERKMVKRPGLPFALKNSIPGKPL